MFDLCIVGGGMSGMTAAITASRLGSKVVLIEKNNKLGKKIYATGNGKCNLTNTDMDYKLHYNSSYEEYTSFLEKSCGVKATEDVTYFVNSLGIITTDNKGYIYPASNQASAVVWAMIDELKHLGVEIILESKVESIHKLEEYFSVNTDKDTIKAKKLILACGGNSYSKLGGSMSGYELAKSLGHNIIPTRPCLCGLETIEDISELSGVRVGAKASLVWDNQIIATENGELQFTDYGLSGILIFNLSSKTGKYLQEGKRVQIKLDLIPNFNKTSYDNLIEANENRTVVGMLNGITNDKIATYMAKKANINPKAKVTDIGSEEIYNIFDNLKDFTVTIKATKDYDNAQVTSGGIDIGQIAAESFMSKLVPNLYITGEMLDIDGLCGGYNITFAILSGIKAGYCSYDKN